MKFYKFSLLLSDLNFMLLARRPDLAELLPAPHERLRRLGTEQAPLFHPIADLHRLEFAEGMMTVSINRCTFRQYLFSFRFLRRKRSEARVKHTCLCVAGHLTATTCSYGATWPPSHSVVTDFYCVLYLAMQCHFGMF